MSKPIKIRIGKNFGRMANLAGDLGVEIVSYGLAPKPNGYCYEIEYPEIWEEGSKKDKEELNYLCDTCPEGFLS